MSGRTLTMLVLLAFWPASRATNGSLCENHPDGMWIDEESRCMFLVKSMIRPDSALAKCQAGAENVDAMLGVPDRSDIVDFYRTSSNPSTGSRFWFAAVKTNENVPAELSDFRYESEPGVASEEPIGLPDGASFSLEADGSTPNYSLVTTPVPVVEPTSSCSPMPCLAPDSSCVEDSSDDGFYCRCPATHRGRFCEREADFSRRLVQTFCETWTGKEICHYRWQ